MVARSHRHSCRGRPARHCVCGRVPRGSDCTPSRRAIRRAHCAGRAARPSSKRWRVLANSMSTDAARALARRLIGTPEQAPLFDDGSEHLTVPVRLRLAEHELPTLARPQVQGRAQCCLRCRAAGVRGGRLEGLRYRQLALADPGRARQEPQGPSRDALAAAAGRAARVVAAVPVAGLAVPRA
jgi:hypothetical protein